MGKNITKEGATAEEFWSDKLTHALKSTLPTPFRSDIKSPSGQVIFSTMGLPLKRSTYGYEKGFPWQDQQRWHDIINREEYKKFKLQKEKYTADEGAMIDLMAKGEITPGTLKQWFLKRQFPASSYYMTHQREIIKAPFNEE